MDTIDMANIDVNDFGVFTCGDDVLQTEAYKYFSDDVIFGENLCITWMDGGRFLELIPASKTDLYSTLLKFAKKIDDDIYEFYLGEYPQIRVSRELSEELSKQFNKYNSYDCNLMLTGRSYLINDKYYPEYSFNNKNYIKYNDDWIQVLPIKWIINDKEKKIISSQVLTTRIYSISWNNSLKKEIMQRCYNGKDNFNVDNWLFKITDGLLDYYAIDDSFYKLDVLEGFDKENVFLPYGITAIKGLYFEKAKYLKIPSSVKTYEYRKTQYLDRLEVYDNIKIVGKLKINDWIRVHYKSFDSLMEFFKRTSRCMSEEMKPIKCFLVGPRLKRRQRNVLKKYPFIDAVIWEHEEKENVLFDNKEDMEIKKDNNAELDNSSFDKSLDSSDTKQEERKEENRAKLLLDKIYKYLENYPNYDKYKEEIDKMVNEYESIIDSIHTSFMNKNKNKNLLSTSLDETYNSFCMVLEGILLKLEKNNECYLMLEYIDKCIKSLNGELEGNNLLLKTLGVYGTKSLEILKEPYKKDYYDKIMAILVDEKEKIQAFIEEYYNNNYGKKEFSYLDAGELESYLRRELYPLFKEITYAVNSEELSRDLQKEALTAMADMANSKIVESENNYIKSQISLISRINKELDNLIDKSPFADSFKKDKEIIMAYVSEDDNESKDYLKDLISKCQNLSGYNEENDKSFMPEYINRMNDSLKSVHSENVKFLNVIKKLQSVIVALNLLELEVNNSIIQNEKFNRYRVGKR